MLWLATPLGGFQHPKNKYLPYHFKGWTVCVMCALPENPSPPESPSSTSPERRRTRRDGNGRSPPVQPDE